MNDLPYTRDHTLGERLAARDSTALDDMLELHGEHLESWIKSKYPAIAVFSEDIVVESIVKVWKSYNKNRGDPIGFWFVVANNCAIDLLAKPWQKARLYERMYTTDEPVLPDSATVIANQICETNSKLIMDVKKILASLSKVERNIILHYAYNHGEKSWTDGIAKETEMTRQQLRAMCVRIKKKIRKRLIQHGHELEGNND